MRVYIQYKNNDNTGKGKFLQRLMPALKDIGVKPQSKSKHADLALGILRWRDKVPKGMPKMLRVDGCYLWETRRTLWRNRLQRASIKRSDGVIWQSEFSQRTVSRVLGIRPKREWVIFNGAPQLPELDTSSPGPPYRVVCSARWEGRPHKRLHDCVAVAAAATRANMPIEWWFCGYGAEPTSRHCPKPLHFAGRLNSSALECVLRGCHVMLNLSYADWCPNAVVEALMAGCRVVINNESGAAELVRTTRKGTVVCVDQDLPRKKLKSSVPPPILVPHAAVASAVLEQCMRASSEIRGAPRELCIHTIAAQYKAAFEEMLNEKAG